MPTAAMISIAANSVPLFAKLVSIMHSRFTACHLYSDEQLYGIQASAARLVSPNSYLSHSAKHGFALILDCVAHGDVHRLAS